MSKRLKIILVAILTVVFSMSVAWAAGEGTTSWKEAATIYKLIRNISIPLATVGVAICGVKMFTGGEDAARRAKKTILIIAGALAALLLLPLAVKAGADLGAKHKWDPRQPVHCYIESVERELPQIKPQIREGSDKT